MTSRLERAVYDESSVIRNVDESYLVDEPNSFWVSNYVAGRCHLAALAIAKIAGLRLGVFLDECPMDLDGEDSTLPVLEHAFCYLDSNNNYLVDARGVRTRTDLLEEYCCDTQEFMELSGDQAEHLIRQWMEHGNLQNFEPGEEQRLETYIQEMYELKLLSDNTLKLNERALEYSDSDYEPS